MKLRQALDQLHDIQATFQQVRQFRLLRAITVLATSLLGIVGSGMQRLVLPSDQALDFVVYWSSIAGIAILITLTSVYIKYAQSRTRWDRELWLEAALRFVPSIMVGAIITATWCWHQSVAVIYLPGIWLLCFGLGVWSSAQVFPRSMYLVAAYYFLIGTLAILLADYDLFSPIWMGLGFGIGQLLMSGVLAYAEQKSQS